MQITFEKLGEIVGIRKETIRVYLDSYRLSKYQCYIYRRNKKGRYRTAGINLNYDFIKIFCKYLKIKQINHEQFRIKAEKLLREDSNYGK